jgi:hypothetical protein
VNVLGAGQLLRLPEVAAPLAVDPPQAVLEGLEAVRPERPVLDSIAGIGEGLDRCLGRRLERARGGAEAVRHQRRAQPVGGPGQPAVALLQAAERHEHHVGVAHAGELAGRVAEAGVLGAVDTLAQLAAYQPQERAQLLHVLARLVDRLLARAVRVAVKLVERMVDATARHPPHLVGHRLSRIEAKRARGHPSSLPLRGL